MDFGTDVGHAYCCNCPLTKMRNAPPEIQRCLTAAEGWLELGVWREANKELEQLPPAWRAAAQVLDVRCKVYAYASRWDDVLTMSCWAAQAFPREPRFPVYFAWAKHRLGKTSEGLQIATSVWKQKKRFPRISQTAYVIACCSGALGRVARAKTWLARTFELNDSHAVKLRALKQSELARVWNDKEFRTFWTETLRDQKS